MASVQYMVAHAIQGTLKEITPPGQDWSESMHASWQDDVDRGSFLPWTKWNELITRTWDVGKKTNGFPVDLLWREESQMFPSPLHGAWPSGLVDGIGGLVSGRR